MININSFYLGNCLDLLHHIDDCSIDAIITDPPYYYHFLTGEWNRETVDSKKYQEKSTVTSLPAGMKFNPAQGKAFYAFYFKVSQHLLRVLKPGGKTVKPVAICEHLIKLVTLPGALVLDPFVGSGTTAVACKRLGRDYIGFDLDPENILIAQRRINDTNT